MRRLILASLLSLFVASSALAKKCIDSTTQFEQMQQISLNFIETKQSVNVKLADSVHKRSMGFQHLCPEIINENMILFVFGVEMQPAFHMRNVHAPLDIAFIDKHGRVVSITNMQPYIYGSLHKPTYAPKVKVVAALETRVGLLQEMGVVTGSTVSW